MKKKVIIFGIVPIFMALSLGTLNTYGQICEWRLVNAIINPLDPDGAGPATGSATFTLQIHTVGGDIPNINVLATGFSFQSTKAMIPTTPGCAIVSNPANVTVSSAFIAGSFAYTTVFQCGVFSQTTGGQTFDRRAVGTLDGNAITLTSTWVDVFTVTLWSLGAGGDAGFVVINTGSSGTNCIPALPPCLFSTYSVSDDLANEWPVNSLTYSTPLALVSGGALPLQFTNFKAECNDKGALLSWGTASEQNSDRFEIQKSDNSTDWVAIGNVLAAGNSNVLKSYQYFDLNGGSAFYRIRQVDKDGRFIYTAIKHTDCKSSQFDITLYPVPASDKLTVIIKSENVIKTDLLIMDMSGRILRRVVAQISKGNNNIILNVRDLPAGQYMITSSNPSIIINKKFTVER